LTPPNNTTPKLNPTLESINNQVVTFTPAVIAAVQIAEAAGGTSESKLAKVLDEISGIAGAVSQIPTNPNVAAIAGLVNLTVSLFNAFGKFKHAAR
jgi:hypothetical protein